MRVALGLFLLGHIAADSGTATVRVFNPSVSARVAIQFAQPHACPPSVVATAASSANGTEDLGLSVSVHDLTTTGATLAVSRKRPEADLSLSGLFTVGGFPAGFFPDANGLNSQRNLMFQRALDVTGTTWAPPVRLYGSVPTPLAIHPGILNNNPYFLSVQPDVFPIARIQISYATDPLGDRWVTNRVERITTTTRLGSHGRLSTRLLTFGNGYRGIFYRTLENSTIQSIAFAFSDAQDSWDFRRIRFDRSGLSIVEGFVLPGGRPAVVYNYTYSGAVLWGLAVATDSLARAWDLTWPGSASRGRPTSATLSHDGVLSVFITTESQGNIMRVEYRNYAWSHNNDYPLITRWFRPLEVRSSIYDGQGVLYALVVENPENDNAGPLRLGVLAPSEWSQIHWNWTMFDPDRRVEWPELVPLPDGRIGAHYNRWWVPQVDAEVAWTATPRCQAKADL